MVEITIETAVSRPRAGTRATKAMAAAATSRPPEVPTTRGRPAATATTIPGRDPWASDSAA
jgi:hypothetical protein